MDDTALVEILDARRERRLRDAWGQWAPRNPNASDLTDCVRFQVLRVVAWDLRASPDVEGMQAMEQGREMEPVILRQLQDEGHELVEQQAPWEILQPLVPDGPRKRVLSGRMDCKWKLDGELIPVEVKATSPYVFDGLSDEDSLRRSPYATKWLRQLMAYCLGHDTERGILYVADRGRRKAIVVHLDYAEAEGILALCVEAVRWIEDLQGLAMPSTEADAALTARGVPYCADWSTCQRCDFRDRACFPEQPAMKPAQVRTDLEELVGRYTELHPLASEAEKLRKAIKAETEGFPVTVAGPYVIEGKVATRRMKEQPAKPAFVSEYWSFKVRKVEPDPGNGGQGAML